MIVEERASTDDDSGRRVFRHQGEGLIPERQTLQPQITGREVDAGKQRLAIACALPHHVSGGGARFGERDASAVASGVYEEDVSRLRHGFASGDASERIRRGAVPTT